MELERGHEQWRAAFTAMASPCEVLVQVDDGMLARRLGGLVEAEARRIEAKFSRYRDDSEVGRINASAGRPVEVDEETARLLDLAHRCHELSHGRFDVTSGILRRVWRFDGSDRIPSRKQVKALLPRVGWEKVRWERPTLVLPAGMEIDLGGLGKEYAVDRAADLLSAEVDAPHLVNFGGDLRASGPRRDGAPWRVGVEDPGAAERAERLLEIAGGGLATSGDARRYHLRRGVRYPHILNPRTGWPVMQAPRSVTVAAGSCTEAGLLATLAVLHGRGAEDFLRAQDVVFWCRR